MQVHPMHWSPGGSQQFSQGWLGSGDIRICVALLFTVINVRNHSQMLESYEPSHTHVGNPYKA